MGELPEEAVPHVAGLAGYVPPVSCHFVTAYDDRMDDRFAIYKGSHFLWNCLSLEADQLLVVPTLSILCPTGRCIAVSWH